MKVMWNDRYRDIIQGLDLLGVRQLDQGLEVKLVGGITTVSPRARYMSLVTWALGSMYRRQLHDGEGDLAWSQKAQDSMLTRLEFLVAASTRVSSEPGGPAPDETSSITGIVGTDVYQTQLAALTDDGATAFPPARRPGLLNAYSTPARGFGLLAPSSDNGPLALTPRGQELAASMTMPYHVERALFDATAITATDLTTLRPHFSLNALNTLDNMPERQRLVAALDGHRGEPLSPNAARFQETRRWAIAQLNDAPATGEGLVDRSYVQLAAGIADADIGRLWGEVALRKRVHFALELMLVALSRALDSTRGSTIQDVVADIEADLAEQQPPPVLTSALGKSMVRMNTTWGSFRDRIAPDAFLETAPRSNDLNGISLSWQLVAALSILSAAEAQSRAALVRGDVRPRAGQAMESTFSIVAGDRGQSLADVATTLLRDEVATRHLRHTMRKMSQQQMNSLRFFPQGRRLVATGTDTRAGYSGTRLVSVLQVMADIGHLVRTGDGFVPTTEGLAWAKGGA